MVKVDKHYVSRNEFQILASSGLHCCVFFFKDTNELRFATLKTKSRVKS